MLDLDYFKRINDTQGHAAGDAALQQVGQLVSDQCRPSDTVCRYGGEEFCIMVPETDEAGAATLAERIRFKLAQTPLELDTRTLSVTASFGVADCVGELDRADDLIERADRAARRQAFGTQSRGAVRVERFAGRVDRAAQRRSHAG